MNLDQFIGLLDRYDARFCFSLRQQLRRCHDEGEFSELNPNALKEIKEFMQMAGKAGVRGAEELCQDIDAFLVEQPADN